MRHNLEAAVNTHRDNRQLHSLGNLKGATLELGYLAVTGTGALREHHKAHTTSEHTLGGLQSVKRLAPLLAVDEEEAGGLASPANERPCLNLLLHNPLKRHPDVTIDKENIIDAGMVRGKHV